MKYMLIVCGRNCFYVVCKENDFTVVKSAGSKRNATYVQDLVYKTYRYILENITDLLQKDFVNKFIEKGISIYKLEVPHLSINLARCDSYSEQLFEYINMKFKLFGYIYIPPEEALKC